mmetsp:Transcript_98785/g.274937  ORF Transcript_98785/g.274937 Transcript_98785/m.274937 type:complete len:114 (+) Transcript_98785:1966-2307(+)
MPACKPTIGGEPRMCLRIAWGSPRLFHREFGRCGSARWDAMLVDPAVGELLSQCPASVARRWRVRASFRAEPALGGFNAFALRTHRISSSGALQCCPCSFDRFPDQCVQATWI